MQPGQWEIIKPDGIKCNIGMGERSAQRLARGVSKLHPGRWTAQEIGSESVQMSSHQFRYTYEGGELVEKGCTPAWLRSIRKAFI